MTPQKKFNKVMREFYHGDLKSHGKKVTDKAQAQAIAYSESGLKAEGGKLTEEIQGTTIDPLTDKKNPITLKEALIEQMTEKGRGSGLYSFTTDDFRSVVKGNLEHKDADYFIRIKDRSYRDSGTGEWKLEYYAVKNGNIFNTSFFAPDSRYLINNQWVWDIIDREKEKIIMLPFDIYGKAVEKYHNEHPSDSMINYDTYTWFKGSNVVILAPNISRRTILPKARKNIFSVSKNGELIASRDIYMDGGNMTDVIINKGDIIYDNKTGKNVEVLRKFKPAKGSALEHEPFLIDIKFNDGRKGINFPFGQRFTKTPIESTSIHMTNGGKLDSIYKTGTSKQLWDAWNVTERNHFLIDHYDMFGQELIGDTNKYAQKFSHSSYENLPSPIKKQLVIHHAMGLYTKGGPVRTNNYKLYFDKLPPIIIKANSEEQANKIYRTMTSEEAKNNGINSVLYEGIDPDRIKKLPGVRLSPAKQKIKNRIATLKQTMDSVSPVVKKSIQKKIDALQKQFDYNPTLKEKIAAQQGSFYLNVDSKYAKPLYQKLSLAGVKSKLHKLNGSTKVVVDHSNKLKIAYNIYSNLLAAQGETAPPLNKIQGKL